MGMPHSLSPVHLTSTPMDHGSSVTHQPAPHHSPLTHQPAHPYAPPPLLPPRCLQEALYTGLAVADVETAVAGGRGEAGGGPGAGTEAGAAGSDTNGSVRLLVVAVVGGGEWMYVGPCDDSPMTRL